MVQIHRNVSDAPRRVLYGKKGLDILLAPLDICAIKVEINNSGEVKEVLQVFPDFEGDEIKAGSTTWGTIKEYDSRSFDEVSPIVTITADLNEIDIQNNIPDTNTDNKIDAQEGQRVTLEVYDDLEDGLVRLSNIEGTITKEIEVQRYNFIDTKVKAYKVKFDQPITPTNIGSRVVPLDGDVGNAVIGMLITTKDRFAEDGAESSVALVYPATLI